MVKVLVPLSLLIASNALAGLFASGETNTLSVKSDASSYAVSGEYLRYTSGYSGIQVSPASASSVKLTVQEQEDWRGYDGVIPVFRQHLVDNPQLLGAVVGQHLVNCRWTSDDTRFTQGTPENEGYSFVFDLSTADARKNFGTFVRGIAPSIMLQDADVGQLLSSLQIE